MFMYYNQIIKHPQWPQKFNYLLSNNSWLAKPITIQTKLSIDITHCRLIRLLIFALNGHLTAEAFMAQPQAFIDE